MKEKELKEMEDQRNQIDLDRCLMGDEAERYFDLREAMEGIKEIKKRYFSG